MIYLILPAKMIHALVGLLKLYGASELQFGNWDENDVNMYLYDLFIVVLPFLCVAFPIGNMNSYYLFLTPFRSPNSTVLKIRSNISTVPMIIYIGV